MRIQKRLNFKLGLSLIFGMVVLAVGVHFLHAYQLRRTSRMLYSEAIQLEEAGQQKFALEFYEHFILLNPSHDESRIRYALLIYKMAVSPQDRFRAYTKLSDAARRSPREGELCRALVPLCLDLQRYKEARDYLVDMRQLGIDDPEMPRQQAEVEIGEKKLDAADIWFQKAVTVAPTDAKLSVQYATFLRTQQGKPDLAESEISRLVQKAGDVAEVRVAAAQYFMRWGDIDKASTVLTSTADEPWAKNIEVLVLMIDVAMDRNQRDVAQRNVDIGLKQYPADYRFSLKAVQLAILEGNRERALMRILPLTSNPPKRLEDLWQLVNLMIDLGQTEQSETLLVQLGDKGSSWIGDYLQGRIRFQKADWYAARVRFDRVLQSAQTPPPLVVQMTYLMQAECFGKLGNPDQQANACRAALQIEEGWQPARKMLASTLITLGQFDEAQRQYRRLPANDADVQTELIRLSIRKNYRLPAPERNWKPAEELLANLTQNLKVDTSIIRLELLTAQDKKDEARKLVDEIRTQDPKQVAPWVYLIDTATQTGDAARLIATIADAERAIGPRADWSMARIRHQQNAAGADLPARLLKTETEELAKLAVPERERFLAGLRDRYLQVGDALSTERVCRQLAELRPNDTESRFRLFELAANRDDMPTCRNMITDLTRIEGNSGALSAYAEADLLLLKARKGDRTVIPAARQFIAVAIAARPFWLPAKILDAELYELDGQTAKALERYETLAESGPVPIETTRKIVQLLTKAGRYIDARTLLSKLPEQAIAKGGLKGTTVALSLLTSQGEAPGAAESRRRGLEEARKTVGPNSTDPKEYLWLGEMALLAGEAGEAETAFRKARDLNAAAPAPWLALIVLYAKTDPKKATAELMAAKAKLPEAQLHSLMAAGYEVLGRLKEASEEYVATVTARPNDPFVIRAVAGFQLRTGEWAKAETSLRKLLTISTSDDTITWARRSLAITLARLGGYTRFQEAETLLAENAKRNESTSADRSVRAMILAFQPGYRREAIQLLETETTNNAAMPADLRYLLAQLYERDGRWQLAQAELSAILKTHERNPVYLAHYTRTLLSHGDANSVEPLIERLVAITGETAIAMELRARFAVKRGRTDEAAKRIVAFAATQNPETQLGSARLLEELGAKEAEQLYRDYAKTSPDPRAILLLAGYLARHDRLSEALTICDEAWKTCPHEAVAQTCIASVRAGKPTPDDIQRVERGLAAAKESLSILIQQADWKQYREQYAEAIAIYRAILTREPKQVVVLNNLAFLIAVKDGQTEEATRLIDAALAFTGPHAEFLDTRAVILTRANRAEEAIIDIQRSIADAPSAVKQFHLTQAYLKANRMQGAVEAYRRAAELGIKPDDFHPLERPELDRVAKAVKWK